MELTTNSVSTVRRSEIFGQRTRFFTFLRMEGKLDLKRSMKQKLPYLETKSETAIWFGESVKKILKTMSDMEFATYLKENAQMFSLGLLLRDRNDRSIPIDEQRWVLFVNNSVEPIATIYFDSTENSQTVASV